MNFRTELNINNWDFEIKYNQKILMLGSCFSENFAHRMQKYKFDCLSNTHGILFSPVAIFNSLLDLFQNKRYGISDLEQKENGIFFHYQLHSRYNDKNPEKLLQNWHQNIELGHRYLQYGHFLILSFGSAWVYQLKETKKYVANCHEQPNYLFQKNLLSPQLLIERFLALIPEIQAQNPKLKIILTLSPVRHLKDGLVENQRSKSILNYFIHELCEQLNNVYYFPAYEILLDDLRDYRFYQEDLLHPNAIALDYIWEKWQNTVYAPMTQNIIKKIEGLHKNLDHVPFSKDENHYLFLQKNLGIIHTLEHELPGAFEIEKQFILKEMEEILQKKTSLF